MKNCHTCALARDHGQTIKCAFKPIKLLAQFPFFPVFHVKVRALAVSKEKIPAKDCPTWKAKKPDPSKGSPE